MTRGVSPDEGRARVPHGWGERGFAYLLVLLVTTVVSAVMLAVVGEAAIEMAMARHRQEATNAEWLSRAAAHNGAWRMRYDATFRAGAKTLGTAGPVKSSLGTGSYQYRVDSGGASDWIIAGTGSRQGAAHTSHQRVADALLASVVVIPCSKDAMISEANPSTNYGTTPTLPLRIASGNRTRLLLHFAIPVTAKVTVESAILELWLGSSTGDEEICLRVYRLLYSWTEGSVTWTMRNPTYYWSYPGLGYGYDYDGTVLAETSVGPRSGVCRWDLTWLVNEIVQGDLSNHGLLIRAKDEWESGAALEERVFASRCGDAGTVPVLLVKCSGGALVVTP